MNPRNATVRESTASEAVVSIDGRVKRRIPNYETVVINIAEGNKAANFSNAINDNYADIPILLDSVEVDHESSVSIKKRGVLILGLIVVITFLWSMYSIFFIQKEQQAPLPLQATATAVYETNHIHKIKQLSDLILQDNDWNNSRLTSILQHWNKLDTSEHKSLNGSSWFQHFKYVISQQIKQHTKIVASTNVVVNKSPLILLAVAFGITNTNGHQLDNADGSTKYQALVESIKSEIAEAELSSKQSQQSTESEATLNTLLRQELAAPNEIGNTLTVSQQEVKALLNKYKEAYESGNLSVISNLFGTSKSNSNENNLTNNFENIFKNTSKRSINFYDYSLEVTPNGAIIKTKYNGMLEFTNNKGTQHIVANAKIVATQNNSIIQIASFELLDSKVSVVTPTLNIPSENANTRKLANPISQIPNAAQLQDLTTKLVTAYETGDIELFSSLFSRDAKTNDRINLEGIREDYALLFQSSSDRQMFIQNLRWTDASNGAKGIGDLEVIVLSNHTNTVYSMKGKIQIVAQQLDGNILITHLYHIERQK
ncbi:hypothetical protein [Kaarinaea lacus]